MQTLGGRIVIWIKKKSLFELSFSSFLIFNFYKEKNKNQR